MSSMVLFSPNYIDVSHRSVILCSRLLSYYCISIGEWRKCLYTENLGYVPTYTEKCITKLLSVVSRGHPVYK